MRILAKILIIFILFPSACTKQDLGGGITVKELELGGERILIGGEPPLGSDTLKTDFKPEVKLEKWGDETFVKIWSEEGGDKTARQVGDRLVWNAKSGNEYHFYIKTAEEIGADEGGFEYEVILKSKPKTNIVSLRIETEGLDFFYQGELTEEEKAEGAERPENIIGSYAVYHKTKTGDYSALGGKNYKTGKAFHIYRPEIIDANGNKIWGDLNIDESAGTLTITIPQDFLNKAAYPVIVDPTLGYTSVGGSTGSYLYGTIRTNEYTTTEEGSAFKMMYYGAVSQGGYIAYYRPVVYLASNLSRVTYGGEVSTNSATKRWLEMGLPRATLSNATAYRIGVWLGSNNSTRYPTMEYDSGLTLYRHNLTYHATNAPTNPLTDDSSIADNKASMYVVYSETSGTVTDVYETAGTFSWEAPAGITSVDVECWGAGGGGGGQTGRTAGGGGAFAGKDGISVTGGSSYTVVVGAGGIGSTANGSNGGDSSFNSTSVIAKGGSGGSSGGGTGGQASASTGDTKYDGGNGASNNPSGGGGGGGAGDGEAGSNGSGTTGGAGGSAGGGKGGNGSTVNAAAGETYGGGGGGSSGGSGWTGADGAVRITYTYAGTSTPAVSTKKNIEIIIFD